MVFSRLQANEAAAWIALSLAPGVGRTTLRRLVDVFGTASAVFEAGQSALLKISGLSARACDSILQGPDMEAAFRALDILHQHHAWIMTYKDDDYPPCLAAMGDRPAILYGVGSRKALSMFSVALVGSRSASSYGLKVAGQLGAGLASHGVCVVSGLALGIDSAAHRACANAKGVTVAVTGTGIDLVYPRRNHGLADRIRERGAVITEYLPGTQPEPRNFPIRNRIISGLSRGVVVVEASRRSGSLITASVALEQGREVMAVPGSIYSFKSEGAHWLLKQGAVLVTCVDDILEAVDWESRKAGAVQAGNPGRESGKIEAVNAVPAGLNGKEARLWTDLDDYPRHIDEIAAACDMSASEAAALLIQMELKGVVQAMPGQMYQRVYSGT